MPSDAKKKLIGKKSNTPSLAMVAERAGVSTATVSRVINGIATNKASEATVKKVQAAVKELGYRPFSAGQALRRKESRMVGVLAASLANPLMSAIVASIEIALREHNLTMVLCDTHETPEIQDEYLQEMMALQVRAIVIVSAVESPLLDQLRLSGVKLLFVNRPDPGNFDSAYVGIDNYQAGVDLADFLLAHGVRTFSLLHGSLDKTAAYWRKKGFLARLETAGLVKSAINCATTDELNHLNVGFNAMGSLLAQKPETSRVLICLSDTIAYGAYRYLNEAQDHKPEDFVFWGFDDSPINDWLANWLNSVGVEAESYGPAILQALQQLWRGEPFDAPVFLPHNIHVRAG